VFVYDDCSLSNEKAEITAVPISSSASAAEMGCRNTAARIQYCHTVAKFSPWIIAKRTPKQLVVLNVLIDQVKNSKLCVHC
jgi:hypothetical protein